MATELNPNTTLYYPLQGLRDEAIAAATSPVGEAAGSAADIAAYRSAFYFTSTAAYFSVSSEECRRLTFSAIPVLIHEAFSRLSPEEKDWVEAKLSGLEAGMAIGIEVWKALGRDCRNRVECLSLWPRWNPLWAPPLCGV
jgi:hypothetical protein